MTASVQFGGNFRLVQHGLPVTDQKTAHDVTGLLHTAMSLNGSALRTNVAPWEQLIYQGKRAPGVPKDSFQADEFRLFTDDTVTALKTKQTTVAELLAAKPDGEIDVATLLNPTWAGQLFQPKTYDVNPFTLRRAEA